MRLVLFILIVFSIFGCDRRVSVKHTIARFNSKPYVQGWSDQCLVVRGQLLTTELIAAMEIKNNDQKKISKRDLDSIASSKSKDKVVTFLVRIEPAEHCKDTLYTHNTDVIYGFGRSDKERETSIRKFNLNLEKQIWLKVKEKRIYPMFCHTEHNFGMENGREIWISFNSSVITALLEKNDTVTLFFQNATPATDLIVLEWPSSIMKKVISGGHS